MTAWGFGVVETWTALWAIGLQPLLVKALILESLVQGARALGFAIPGALGVQEGGYLLICAGLGFPASAAVALSVIRRLRELILGFAGLGAWRLAPSGPSTS